MTLSVGLLGLGYFARFHRESWGRMKGARLTATADADPAKGADHAGVDALLGTAPDIVDIATPPPTHAHAIRAALAADPAAASAIVDADDGRQPLHLVAHAGRSVAAASTTPPAAVMRARSSGASGRWDGPSTTGRPRQQSTACESPTVAT